MDDKQIEEYVKRKARELFEKGTLYRKDRENQAVIPLDWARDFIHSILSECKPVALARKIKHPGTLREEEWIRVK